MLLLDCGIIRHAPFADCGRPLWDLMTDQPWFETDMPWIDYFRHMEATRREPPPPAGRRWWPNFRMNGRHAVCWLEQYADDREPDRLLLVGNRSRPGT